MNGLFDTSLLLNCYPSGHTYQKFTESRSIASCTLKGSLRHEAIRRGKLCGERVGNHIDSLLEVDVILRSFKCTHTPKVKSGFWTRESMMHTDPSWKILSPKRASLVMSTLDDIVALYVPYQADPIVKRNLQYMPHYDVLKTFQRPVEKRGCEFNGSMYMVGWRFDMFRNRFQRYACKRYFPKIYKAVVARHFQAMSRLEKRHLPVHARAARNAQAYKRTLYISRSSRNSRNDGCDLKRVRMRCAPRSAGYTARINWLLSIEAKERKLDICTSRR